MRDGSTRPRFISSRSWGTAWRHSGSKVDAGGAAGFDGKMLGEARASDNGCDGIVAGGEDEIGAVAPTGRQPAAVGAADLPCGCSVAAKDVDAGNAGDMGDLDARQDAGLHHDPRLGEGV